MAGETPGFSGVPVGSRKTIELWVLVRGFGRYVLAGGALGRGDGAVGSLPDGARGRGLPVSTSISQLTNEMSRTSENHGRCRRSERTESVEHSIIRRIFRRFKACASRRRFEHLEAQWYWNCEHAHAVLAVRTYAWIGLGT